jgi:flavorubredoxin
MNTRVDEIADGIFRLSSFVPEIAAPAGFVFNQFLIRDDEPLLFHTGTRAMFEGVRAAVARVLPPESLRWISFSHVEADECGSMNQWLALAPRAQVVHGELACAVSLNDMADRPPLPLAADATLGLGRHRVRLVPTPHLPHGWDAAMMFETTTATLFCSDLFTRIGDDGPTGSADPIPAAIEGEALFQATSIGPTTAPTLRRLAELEPRVLALMHGPAWQGDGADALRRLADHYALLAQPQDA